MARLEGFEPPTPTFVALYSSPLSYRRMEQDIGFEPMTFSLATRHSTTELILHYFLPQRTTFHAFSCARYNMVLTNICIIAIPEFTLQLPVTRYDTKNVLAVPTTRQVIVLVTVRLVVSFMFFLIYMAETERFELSKPFGLLR